MISNEPSELQFRIYIFECLDDSFWNSHEGKCSLIFQSRKKWASLARITRVFPGIKISSEKKSIEYVFCEIALVIL